MPIHCFGIDSHTAEVRGKIVQNVTVTPEFLRKLAQKTEVSELFVCRGVDVLETFVSTEQRKRVESELLKAFERTLGMSGRKLSRHLSGKDGAEALREFFRRAIGLRELGATDPDIQSFREQFAAAREANLIGPHLSKLYQRSLWLAEKTRIEHNLQRNATTPASVVSDLAQKIFGDLQNHTALIAAKTEECVPFAKKLLEKNAGHLLFIDTGQEIQAVCDAYGGKLVARETLAAVVPSVDMILLFDEQVSEALLDLQISRIMHKRHNAPLLLVSLLERPDAADHKPKLTGHYNVYSYDKDDLEDIVNANLKEHEKITVSIHRLIEREVSSFYAWVKTNEHYRFGNIIGKSQAMQKIMDLVARIAQSDISVLIDGESGTGKELVAKAIHEHSARVNHPFIAVNCGAIPETLLESELFGHVKGAFTGASSNKKGLIEAANRGTIFLDEIGETSPATQVKLLRFLQEGEVKPVGSNETLELDVRVITATNRDLAQMVDEGRFRKDLYYRLNVIQITLPPLRERTEDILPLAEFFIKKYATQIHKTVYGLDEEAQKLLCDYSWQGNVRELENAIERAVALASGQFLSVEDLPPALTNSKPSHHNLYSGDLTLKELEKRHIASLLRQHNWNYDLVTKILGIGRTTLWRKMREYNISQ
ncbi:MAG: sigma 54-interacting transcriptional regulator [bacterium]